MVVESAFLGIDIVVAFVIRAMIHHLVDAGQHESSAFTVYSV